jgi:hypothetical protein
MPYAPANTDILAVPNWEKKHPDLHKRYISMKPDKMRGHTWDFGTGGYVPYGSQFTTLTELKDAARELGLSEAHVNTALQRITVGDLMLAFIPKEEAERRRAELLASGRERQDAAVDSFLAQKTKGITPRVFETEEEYKDIKKHATREGNNRVGYQGRAR